MNYIFHILILINIYIILALSLNLLIGYTGLLSVSHAVSYGLGAYISTLLMVDNGINFFLALICGFIGSMLINLIIAIPSVRLRGDYFVLGSLGFQFILYSIFYNWVSVTKGPYGIPGIPKPSLFGYVINSIPEFFVLSLIVMFIVYVIIRRLINSPFGRLLQAIRDDEIAALALGKNISKYKIYVFILAGGFAAIAGSLYASYISYIDPTSFTLDESIFIISIIIVGGVGNIRGPILGAIFLVLLPEVLRFLQIPDSIAPNVRQMIYGLSLVLLMYFRPKGLFGTYAFD